MNTNALTRAWTVLRRALAVGGLLVLALIVALQLPPSARWIAETALHRVFGGDSVSVDVSRARLGLPGILDLEGLRVDRADGSTLLSVDAISVRYRVLPLFNRQVHLESVRVVQPDVDVRRENGSWELARLVAGDPAQARTGTPSPWTVSIGRLAVVGGEARAHRNGELRGAVTDLELSVSDLTTQGGLSVVVESLALDAISPETPGTVRVAVEGALQPGSIRVDTISVASPSSRLAGAGELPWPLALHPLNRLGFRLYAPELALGDFSFLALDLNPAATLSLDAEAHAEAHDRARLSLVATASDGSRIDFQGTGAVDSVETSPGRGHRVAAFSGSLSARRLDPSHLVTTAPSGDLSVEARADLRRDLNEATAKHDVWKGTVEVAWGASSLAEVALAPGRLDARAEDGAVAITVRGRATLPEGRVAAGVDGRGSVRPWDAPPVYEAAASVTIDGASPERLSARLEGRGAGMAPDGISGTWTVSVPTQSLYGVATAGEVSFAPESGTGPWRLAITHGAGSATGHGRLSLAPGFRVAADELSLDSLDVARLLGDTTTSSVSLVANGNVEGAGGPGMSGHLEVESIEGSWGPLPLPSGIAVADLVDGRARASFEGRVGGGTLDLTGRARPFDPLPSVTIEQASFASVDPGIAAGGEPVPASLNGRLEGRVEGFSPRQARGRLTLSLDSSRVVGQTISSATVAMDLAGGTATADITVAFPDGGVEGQLTAAVEGSGVRRVAVPRLSFRDLDVGRLLADSTALRTALNGTAAGSLTLDADSIREGTAAIELRASRVNEGAIEDGNVTVTVADGTVQGSARVRTRTGSLSGDGSGVLDGTRLRSGEATVGFDLSDLDSLLGLSQPASVAGRARFASVGQGGSDGEWRFAADLSRGRLGSVELDTLAASGLLRAGAVDVDTVSVIANALRADGAGLLILDPAVDGDPTFTLDAEVTDAQPLAALMGAETVSVDSAKLEARTERTAAGILFSGETTVNAFLVDDLEVVGLDGDWRLIRGPSGGVDSVRARITASRISNRGLLNVGSAEVDATYDGGELLVEAEAEIDEARSGELRAIVDPASRGRRLRIEQFTFSVDEDRWTLQEPVPVDLRDGVEVGSTVLAAASQRISLGGRLHATETDTFRVSTDRFQIATVADLVGFPRLQGTLTTDLVFTGSLRDPRWDATATAVLDGSGVERDGSVDLRLGYGETRLDTELTLRDGGGRSVDVSGFVPVHLDFTDSVSFAREAPGEASLDVQADSFDIRWFGRFLDEDALSGLRGRLAVDATVTGQTGNPALSGRARISRGALSLPSLGTEYADVDLRLALEGRRIRVVEGSLRSDDASASISGFVELESLGLGRFDVAAELDAFPLIATATAQARASGELRLGGTTRQPRVEGTVEIVSADVQLPGQSTGRSLETVELTRADYDTLREVFGYRPDETEQDYGALYEALAADVSLTIGRDSWLRQRSDPELAVQLTGELSIVKQPGEEPTVIGTVTPVESRSYLEQWGRRFQLASGEIVFQGPPLEPRIQLAATYDIPSRDNPGGSEVIIRLEVEGKPDSLRLILGSTPSMDNADIVSYIATGRPAAALSSSEGGPTVSEVGVELAAGQLTSAIEGLAAEAIGLDVVEIRREGPRDVVLVAGRYVSPRLYLGFQQPVSFGSSESLTQERLGQRVEIEYEAFRWLLLNLEGGQSDVEFFFRSRYGY